MIKTYWKTFEKEQEKKEFFDKLNACEEVLSITIIPFSNLWLIEWEVEIE